VLTAAATAASSQRRVNVKYARHLIVEQISVFIGVRLR